MNDLITTDKHPALFDVEFQRNLMQAPWQEWLAESPFLECREEYTNVFHKWIQSNKYNTLNGLDAFKRRDVIVGTTQELDEAYWRHSNKRLRIYRGEYAYHSRNINNYVFLEDESLETGDYAIISIPFAGTGEQIDISKILNEATNKNVPVIIDCAWWGAGWDTMLDLNHSAIETVCFSLSKNVGLGNMRTGLRYSNLQTGPIVQQNNFNHLVKSNMKLGIYQMNTFSSDWVVEKYKAAYERMCGQTELEPSKCLHVAWQDSNLVGVRNLVKHYRTTNG